MIYGDYHTHTTYSHGKGSIEENVRAAAEKGLKEIAITDHGLDHLAFGLKRAKIAEVRATVDALNKSQPVRVLFGIEANVLNEEGAIDVRPEEVGEFDVILAGFHKMVKGQAGFILPNVVQGTLQIPLSDSRIRKNTAALVRAIRKNPIDVLAHINHDLGVDPVEVAKAAADYGVLLELNGTKSHLSDEQLFRMNETGVTFLLNSDAHVPEKVGEVELPLAQTKRVGITRIANWNAFPTFRVREEARKGYRR